MSSYLSKIKLEEELNRALPHHKGLIKVSNHAAERIAQRYGRLSSQLLRAINSACKELKKNKQLELAYGETYIARVVMKRTADCYLLITVLYNN